MLAVLEFPVVMSVATVGRGSVAHFECPEGSAAFSHERSVVLVKMVGRVDAAVAKQIAAALDTVLGRSQQPLATFFDLQALEHYHSDVRVLCTKALLRNWSKVASVHTLAKIAS